MKTETYVTLERDEVSDVLSYRLIAECIGSSRWNSGKISMARDKTFTATETSMIRNIYQKAHKWYLVTGVPNEVTMTLTEFNLWKKLKEFCVENMTVYGKERNNA